jgi:hypothetical protein
MNVSASVSLQSLEDDRIAAWRQIISTLLDWLKDPGQLEDIAYDAPTEVILMSAIGIAKMMINEPLFPAPQFVISDPNGGIVFQRSEGNTTEVIQIWDDEVIEYIRFQGTQVKERSILSTARNVLETAFNLHSQPTSTIL